MTKKRRLAVFAVLLAVMMLFSALYIVLEANHDCQGEDCAICLQICACLNLLQNLSLALSLLAAAAIFLISAEEIGKRLSYAYQSDSLITLKVKLSD